ncbi:MAG: ADP-ribosylglycohydrolase family protein, partial [Lachnospiraceae bacterium]|nr:ADP-ribosylglycohydrolase family protein [Lachnospiraceae bacterium]
MYKNDNLQKFFKDSSREVDTDRIRGCLFGGAVGDALGYAVEFLDEETIAERYGKDGIREYQISEKCGKALISDDT